MQGAARQPFVQQGDMLLTKVFPWPRHGTVVTAVPKQPDARAFTDSVVVLRPRQPLTPDENLFFLRYFNSHEFLNQFAALPDLAISIQDPCRSAIFLARTKRRCEQSQN